MGNTLTQHKYGGANLPPELLMNVGSFADSDTASKLRRTAREGLIVNRPYGPFAPPPSYPDTSDYLLNRPMPIRNTYNRWIREPDTHKVAKDLVTWLVDNDSYQNRDKFVQIYNSQNIEYMNMLYAIYDGVRHHDISEVYDTVKWVLNFLNTKIPYSEHSSIEGKCWILLRTNYEMGEWFLEKFFNKSQDDINDVMSEDGSDEDSDED